MRWALSFNVIAVQKIVRQKVEEKEVGKEVEEEGDDNIGGWEGEESILTIEEEQSKEMQGRVYVELVQRENKEINQLRINREAAKYIHI